MKLRTVVSKLVLLPCSKLYGAITYVRNKMFDFKILPTHSFEVPIIVVGNISCGGTGKTPITEYIIDALRLKYHIAMVSRGYKRDTKGFVIATSHSTPSDIGDEAFQIYKKFDGKVVVAVGEDRVNAIKEVLAIDPAVNLVVLDDAFQHRYVQPTLSIVVTECNRPYYNDHMLPYGRLRESKMAVNRADFVVVSKCPPTLKDIDYRIIAKSLNLFPCQELFFSRMLYQELVPLFPEQTRAVPYLDWMSEDDGILAVAGIGNPRPFVRYLKSFKPRVRVNVFSDHHKFTKRDMELLLERFKTMRGSKRVLITTEKDAVRMVASPYFPAELRSSTFYLPIKLEFSSHSTSNFAEAIERHLRKTIKKS